METSLTVKMSEVRSTVKVSGEVVTFTFFQAPKKGVKLDTKTATQFTSRSFDCTELPEHIYQPCESARHGIKQKLGDSLAMNKEARNVTSLQEAVTILETLWDQLHTSWKSATRVTGATIKLDDLAIKFHHGVITGITTFEQASELYRNITGKELPPLPGTSEPDTTEEESTEEEVTTEGDEQ